MIRLYSTSQSLALRGHIPELAILRSQQFQGAGYSPEEHGHIIVMEAGDDLNRIPEVGPEGLYDADGLPHFEFVEVFTEQDGSLVFEVVIVIDNSRTVALIIPDDPGFDPSLRTILRHAAGTPQPLPQHDLT
jgi:hypothetical protein